MGLALGTSAAPAAEVADGSVQAPRPSASPLSGLQIVLYSFVASRLALLAVGLMTQTFIEPYSTHVSPMGITDNPVLRMWGQWDAGWYYGLALEGYATHAESNGQANWVFFPAFPMLSAALARLTPMSVFVSMLVVSNVSFLVALMLIHRFARAEFDQRTADITVALICAAPGSYIFSSAYTESLFLMALSACLLLLRSRRWLAAGGFAGLAVLTRNLGVGLVLPFVFAAAPSLWALRRQVPLGAASARQFTKEALRVAGGFALPALALAAFCLHLYLKTGDPVAFLTGQKAWERSFGLPFLTPLLPLLDGQLDPYNLLSFAAAWLSLAMLVPLALMRRWSLFALGAFLTLAPLSSGFMSYARYSLVALPVFLAGAGLLASRPAAAMATLVVFATLNGFMMVAWTLCMWVAA